MPAWASIIVNTQLAWLVSWHEAGACGTSETIGNREKSWSDEVVKPETHGFMVPIDDAKLFFYRGHFDTWQLEREKWPQNDHLIMSAAITVKELTRKGFKIENFDLKYECRVHKVLELYPIYIRAMQANEQQSHIRSTTIMNVSLSTTRTKYGEEKLSYTVPKEFLKKVGTKSLIRQNTWRKCDPERGCRYFADIPELASLVKSSSKYTDKKLL
jgi:hypothetical protein